MLRRSLLSLCIMLSSFNAIAQHQQSKKFNVKERFISSAGLTYSILDKEVLYGANFTPSLNLLNSFSDFSVSLAMNAGAA